MRFVCPHCHKVCAIDDAECGEAVGCGHCGGVSVVPESRFAPGAVIDDFIIREILGHGGMGTVYLAHQVSLDRPVALKILREEFASNNDFIVDFIKEARAAARLNHPNIVQSYMVGAEDDIYFFAMEYVEGMTLKRVLDDEGPVPVERALNIGQQIAEALDFAWKQQQLVHRDIKPDNIMITNRGVAKLADLGLARAARELVNDDADEVMGTPQYICPEQLLGRPMDVRGDIYSLGATLYHAMTGQFPFDADSAGEIARMHLQEPLRPPHKVSAAIPGEVSYIVCKMMAKKVEDRYEDASELTADIRAALAGKTPRGYEGPGDSGMRVVKPSRVPQTATPPPDDDDLEDDDDAPEADPAEAPPEEETGSAPAVDPEATPSGSRKMKIRSKKVRIRGKTTTSLTAATGTAAVGDVALPPGVGPAPKPKKKKMSVLGCVGIAAGVIVLLVLAIGGFIFFKVSSIKKANTPTSLAEARELYLSRHPDQREAWEQIRALAERDDLNDEETQQLVAACASFRRNFPESLFVLQPEEIGLYSLVFVHPFPPLAGPELKQYGEQLAGRCHQILAQHEEALIRNLREQEREDEVLSTIMPTLQDNFRKQALAATDTQLQEYADERHAELTGILRRLQNDLRFNDRHRDQELAAIRPELFRHTMYFRYREASSLLKQKRGEEEGYRLAIKDRAEAVTQESENRAAEALFDRLVNNQHSLVNLDQFREEPYSNDQLVIAQRLLNEKPELLTVSDLRNRLNELLKEKGINELRQQIREAGAAEKKVYESRHAWFEQHQKGIDAAKTYRDLLTGSGERFKDSIITLPTLPPAPNKAKIRTKVERLIGERVVVVGRYYDKGVPADFTFTVHLLDLGFKQYGPWARTLSDESGGNLSDLILQEAAFLAYSLQDVETAKQRLAENSGSDVATFLAGELTGLDELIEESKQYAVLRRYAIAFEGYLGLKDKARAEKVLEVLRGKEELQELPTYEPELERLEKHLADAD